MPEVKALYKMCICDDGFAILEVDAGEVIEVTPSTAHNLLQNGKAEYLDADGEWKMTEAGIKHQQFSREDLEWKKRYKSL